MDKNAKHIAIVGGGTAGWLAALVLKRAAEKAGQTIRFSVIEAPDIPTVGVGEGSTSVFRQVLLDLGIDESEFLRETGATFKFGIHHKGWRAGGKHFFGPIDDPNALGPVPAGLPANWLHHARIASGKSLADAHLFTALMRARKSPFARSATGDPIALSPFHHAYHFDQARLGAFLARKAKNIDHIRAQVAGLKRASSTGNITDLIMTDGAALPVDFVIDCTGFRRAIIGELQAGWTSYGKFLPLNRAMPFWMEHDPNKDIAPYTTAQAVDAGWIWAIPVQDRMGCGYVFSDAHITPDAAQAEIETKLGKPIEPRGVLSIEPGRLNHAWVNNCVAIGLAQSFLEPLEATSIHGSLVQTLILTRLSFDTLLGPKAAQARIKYNMTVARQVNDFAQFINLHYAGGRTDTAFWTDMTHSGLTGQTQAQLRHWQAHPVTRADFQPFAGNLPHVEEQLYAPVLAGLGKLPAACAKQVFANHPRLKAQARKTLMQLDREFKSAALRALGHRAYLTQL
ncbi:tryptophan halogenase [Pacificibacter maritimus]|uniref:Tryptophan halogenase n=1 Tax=Pacificibacter maritimus TaxID=762213 RepID=A0A3N4UMW0_9RHOB|nr:tryptophan halogenase family protein [Pacificibacter maritimus]RPE71358.1 tryptophan halogenase [Pacificibacter maritimus]